MRYLVFTLPAVIMMILLILTKADYPVHCRPQKGCCPKSNYGPGPLNLSLPTGDSDIRPIEGHMYVYMCLGKFTSFVWYKEMEDGQRVPYPWENNTDRIKILGDYNQTIYISDLKKSDAAVYWCRVSNGTDFLNGTFTANVSCNQQEKFTFATDLDRYQSVELHSKKILTCAVHYECKSVPLRPVLYWEWHPDHSDKHPTIIYNDTLQHVRVRCKSERGSEFFFTVTHCESLHPYDDYHQLFDYSAWENYTGEVGGQNCSLLIDEVDEELFKGEFVCRAENDRNKNQTVRFRILEKKSQWTYIGPSLAAVILIAIIGLSWYHRDDIRFRFKGLPDRGTCKHDALVLYDEDCADLVRDILEPKLKECEYDASIDVVKPEHPETVAQAEAILVSYCIILVYSNSEMQRLIDFLLHTLKQKTYNSVIFIRFCNTPPNNDVWKNKNFKSFKVMNWPGGRPVRYDVMSRHDSREMENFWKKLRRNLPDPAKKQQTSPSCERRNGVSRQTEISSTSSNQPLLDVRHSNGTGSSVSHPSSNYGLSQPLLDVRQSVRDGSSEAIQGDEEKDSGFNSPLARSLSDKVPSQPCHLPKCTSTERTPPHPDVLSSDASANLLGFPDTDLSHPQNFSSQSSLTRKLNALGELSDSRNVAQQPEDVTGLHHEQKDAPHSDCWENLIDLDDTDLPGSSNAACHDQQRDCRGPRGQGNVQNLIIGERDMGVGHMAEGGLGRRLELQESGYHSLSPPINPSPSAEQHMVPSGYHSLSPPVNPSPSAEQHMVPSGYHSLSPPVNPSPSAEQHMVPSGYHSLSPPINPSPSAEQHMVPSGYHSLSPPVNPSPSAEQHMVPSGYHSLSPPINPSPSAEQHMVPSGYHSLSPPINPSPSAEQHMVPSGYHSLSPPINPSPSAEQHMVPSGYHSLSPPINPSPSAEQHMVPPLQL